MSRKRDKYVDLKINGRLFPTYILANFKSYKLPEVLKTDEDPCSKQTKAELRKYQLFLSKYLDYNSPYKNILIYHGVGSGKTASTINIYNVLYNASPGWNVFLLIKATLKNHPWITDLERWLEEEDKKFRFQNIVFISYDAPNADKTFMDAIKNADSSKKSLYIVDEAHNFIRNVYSNITTQQGRRAQVIYDYMIQDQKENEGTKVILLSGTPAINTPFELALMFNLLRPGIFPRSETRFNQEFISTTAYRTIIPGRKNLFQRRIMGLVSFYVGATADSYASKTIQYVDVVMSKYQEDIYGFFENKEEEMARKMREKSFSSETYKSYTRQACNFVFPYLEQGSSGESRPRPNNFKVSENEGQKIEKAKDLKVDKSSTKYYNVQNYYDAIERFVRLFDELLMNKQNEDEKNKHTILDDIKTYREKYNNDYISFHKQEKTKSLLYEELHKCSAKFLHVIFNILISKGPVLVYSNYVLMEGLQIFKIYLKYFGFSIYDPSNPKTGKDGFRYAEYHGGIEPEVRSSFVEVFSKEENKYGDMCKIMMISPAGSEGISLMSIRQVHLVEPYWHEVRMTQMIGRAIRMCSHRYLPLEERHVDVYRYKSVRDGSNSKWTTDQYIEDLARSKEGLIQSFLDVVREVAVDCELNKNHNKFVQDIKCFQFDEQTLFDEQIGPAYKEDLYDDIGLDNGSNSLKSQTVRIKVIKIAAVKELSNNKYSQSENYWYNSDTGIIYDYDLIYPIGKVGFDEDGMPKKIDKDTYIIDKIIPIPMIDNK